MNNLIGSIYVAVTDIKAYSLPNVKADDTTITTILGITYAIIGAAALLMITKSGLEYIVSAGDPQKTSNAKNGIVYALIGLVVAISAQAITVFVAKRL